MVLDFPLLLLVLQWTRHLRAIGVERVLRKWQVHTSVRVRATFYMVGGCLYVITRIRFWHDMEVMLTAPQNLPATLRRVSPNPGPFGEGHDGGVSSMCTMPT